MNQIPEFSLLTVAFICLVILAILFQYIATLQNTIKATNPKNRSIEPNEVWLCLIPFIGMFFHFSHIKRIADTLKSDFNEKEIRYHSDTQFGAEMGYRFSLLYILNFILSIWVYYNLMNDANYFSEENLKLIYIVSSIGSLVGFIYWIIYWVKIGNCKNLLLLNNNHYVHNNGKVIKDYSFSSQTGDKNKKCNICNTNAFIDDNFCMKCGGAEFSKHALKEKIDLEIPKENEKLNHIEKECPKCKLILNNDSINCHFCGFAFFGSGLSSNIFQDTSPKP